MEGPVTLFVYGTLKRGLRNHHWMQGGRFLGEAVTEGRFRLFDCGGFPGLVQDPSGYQVRGEVWEVPPGVKRRLDVLERVAEGEYDLLDIRLTGREETVPVYRYLRSVAGLADAGPEWKE
jgi:gamma-glutamylcyclotransferase (GGCT)/AIG2-like uncharacterized protein YtfP